MSDDLSEFNCLVCLELLFKPVGCLDCNCILCTACYNDIHNLNGYKCPKCRSNKIPVPNKYIELKINEEKKCCPVCDEEFIYKDLERHISEKHSEYTKHKMKGTPALPRIDYRPEPVRRRIEIRPPQPLNRIFDRNGDIVNRNEPIPANRRGRYTKISR